MPFIREVVYLPTTGSTNDVAHRLASQGAPHATLIVTDDQTAGRGRLGRAWYMPPRAALAMSLLVRPDLAAVHANRLTMLAGLAAAEGVERATGLAVRLKWPNDVVLEIRDWRLEVGERAAGHTPGVKKVGGILTETAIAGERLDYAVVGIGLNVNVDFAGQPDLAETATSIMLQLGREVDRLSVLAAVVDRFAERYEWLDEGDALRAAWSERLVTLQRHVEARVGDSVLTGWAEAVDDDGALLLRAGDGSMHRLLAADVTLREP
ncbi:MAG TPA: biotin--[acetyl-CoA-carboxylase] ligase [Anaerolineae bacterium]|nr:biotin--[acetyl-CoA-carboxylase] ligase [Anaerolineae bacterium]